MSAQITADDIRDFSAFLRGCTDSQVQGCYEKETAAGRDAYVALVEIEAGRRGITLEHGPSLEEQHGPSWAIFESDERGLEIQRCDDNPRFDSDEEARAAVYADPGLSEACVDELFDKLDDLITGRVMDRIKADEPARRRLIEALFAALNCEREQWLNTPADELEDDRWYWVRHSDDYDWVPAWHDAVCGSLHVGHDSYSPDDMLAIGPRIDPPAD